MPIATTKFEASENRSSRCQGTQDAFLYGRRCNPLSSLLDRNGWIGPTCVAGATGLAPYRGRCTNVLSLWIATRPPWVREIRTRRKMERVLRATFAHKAHKAVVEPFGSILEETRRWHYTRGTVLGQMGELWREWNSPKKQQNFCGWEKGKVRSQRVYLVQEKQARTKSLHKGCWKD